MAYLHIEMNDEAIAKLLARKGWEKEDWSRASGIHMNTIWRALNKNSGLPSLYTAFSLAKALEVRIEDIVDCREID